jgi:hypothetical protein
MGTAIDIWNLLWDIQIPLVVCIVLVIWLIVRGGDLMRWIWRKLRPKAKDAQNQAQQDEMP